MVSYARWLQFKAFRYNKTFDQFEEDANEIFQVTEVVLQKLRQDVQEEVSGKRFRGGGDKHYVFLEDYVSVIVDRTIGCNFAESKTVARWHARGHWLFCRMTVMSCINALKDRVRHGRLGDNYNINLYKQKIEQLEAKMDDLNHDQDVNPIEVAYLRDLVEGV